MKRVVFLLTCQGWPSFSVQEVSRRNWVSAPGCLENSFPPFLIIPTTTTPPTHPSGQVGHQALPLLFLKLPTGNSPAPFRLFLFLRWRWEGEKKCLKFEGLLLLFLGFLLLLQKKLGWIRISPHHLYWILQMVFPLGKEERRIGDRILGGIPALTSSAGPCTRLTPTHWGAPRCFCWEASPLLGFSRSYSDSLTALQGVLVYTVYETLNTLNFGPEK